MKIDNRPEVVIVIPPFLQSSSNTYLELSFVQNGF